VSRWAADGIVRRERRGWAAGTVVAGALLVVWIAVALAAPQASDPLGVEVGQRLSPPSTEHPFGTDQFGRDVLARVLWGSRYGAEAVVVTTLLSGVAGTALGATAGYAGGWIDGIVSRVLDLWLALPSLLFAIALAGALGPSFTSAVVAIGVMRVPSFARVARAAALAVRRAPHVEAALGLGAARGRIVARHVVPSVLAPLWALAGARAATALLAGSALSFVGLGAPIPEPEWGALAAAGRPYLAEAWWVTAFPCLATTLAALSLQLLGDALGRTDGRG
jgi:peptide/nickel transport system permease protein